MAGQLFFLVQPFITALPALFECSSHAGEQLPISVAIVILIVLSPWAVILVAISSSFRILQISCVIQMSVQGR